MQYAASCSGGSWSRPVHGLPNGVEVISHLTFHQFVLFVSRHPRIPTLWQRTVLRTTVLRTPSYCKDRQVCGEGWAMTACEKADPRHGSRRRKCHQSQDITEQSRRNTFEKPNTSTRGTSFSRLSLTGKANDKTPPAEAGTTRTKTVSCTLNFPNAKT